MTSITIKIPDSYTEILKDTGDTLYIEALNTVAQKKMRLKRKELSQIKKKGAKFEKKYACSYDEFQKNMSDALTEHDDWIEWTYLKESENELEAVLQKLKLLLSE